MVGPKRLSVAFALGLATVASADFDPDAYPRYETCALCHGLFGNTDRDKFPKLAGQRPAYLEAQIRAFLSGDRTNDGGQMANIVEEIYEEEIAIVVDWFSTQDPPIAAPLPDGNSGEELVGELGCISCHGQSGMPDVPYLSAQHSAYLAKQMLDFKEERRTFPAIAVMHRNLLSISEAEITEIADYLAAQDRPHE